MVSSVSLEKSSVARILWFGPCRPHLRTNWDAISCISEELSNHSFTDDKSYYTMPCQLICAVNTILTIKHLFGRKWSKCRHQDSMGLLPVIGLLGLYRYRSVGVVLSKGITCLCHTIWVKRPCGGPFGFCWASGPESSL